MADLYEVSSYWLIAGLAQCCCLFCLFLLFAQRSRLRGTIKEWVRNKKLVATTFFSLCLFVCTFSNPNIYRLFECEDIRTMPEGYFCYYVDVTPERPNQTFTFPALVSVEKNEYGTSYRLCSVYFDDKKYVYYGIVDAGNEEFIIGNPFSFVDQESRYWECSFTNVRARYAFTPFYESDDAPVFNTMRLIFNALVLIITYISFIIGDRKTKTPPRDDATDDLGRLLALHDSIEKMIVMRQNALRDLNGVDIEDVEDAYEAGILSQQKYDEVKNAIAGLNVILSMATPARIQEMKIKYALEYDRLSSQHDLSTLPSPDYPSEILSKQ